MHSHTLDLRASAMGENGSRFGAGLDSRFGASFASRLGAGFSAGLASGHGTGLEVRPAVGGCDGGLGCEGTLLGEGSPSGVAAAG
jgi:hypothetical protein